MYRQNKTYYSSINSYLPTLNTVAFLLIYCKLVSVSTRLTNYEKNACVYYFCTYNGPNMQNK